MRLSEDASPYRGAYDHLLDSAHARAKTYSVLGKLARPVLVAMLSLSLGLHWSLLQSVAWLGMIVSYSHESSFTEAVQKTFDGQHPCNICKVVTEGKKSEKKREAVNSIQKLDLIFVPLQPNLFPPKVEFSFCLPVTVSGQLSESPPKPPPRLA